MSAPSAVSPPATAQDAESPVMTTYAPASLTFERGEGSWLITPEGDRYLDFASGIATNVLGHAHPAMIRALTGQAEKLWHCSNLFRIPGQEAVARMLCAHSFADRVFFCNSGAEANEGAVKIARKYQSHQGHPERWRVIAASNAFHGRTTSMLAAGGNPAHLAGFGPEVQGFDRVSFGNLNELRQAITAETAAILVEPIQGEGGIHPASPQYLQGLRATADEFDLVLIHDEVQCGMGRTGRMFAHQWAEQDGQRACPDVMSSAKGLGGGFPVGAVLASQKVCAGMGPGSHGSTFGGNPLAMAVTGAVLEEITRPGFLEQVRAHGHRLQQGLARLVATWPHVFSAWRGQGLMCALACVPPAGELVQALQARRMLVVPAGGNALRLLPALTIGEAELDQGLDSLDRVAAAYPESAPAAREAAHG